jgi:fluoride exporter
VTAVGWLLVAPAGALGAVARYGTGAFMSRRYGLGAPWGVLAVNLAGAFLLGLLVGARPGDAMVLALGTGFLGAFTTFSTWMVETDALAVRRRWREALWNLAGPAAGGVVLAGAGFAAGSALG